MVSVRAGVPGTLAALALLCLASGAQGQEIADPTPAEPDVTEMETVQVIGRRPQELYRSKPVERTPATVFERDWREPLNLRKIGLEGGIVPLLVRYLGEQAKKGAEKIPGWKKQVQPAVARPAPLDAAQADRAMRLQQDP